MHTHTCNVRVCSTMTRVQNGNVVAREFLKTHILNFCGIKKKKIIIIRKTNIAVRSWKIFHFLRKPEKINETLKRFCIRTTRSTGIDVYQDVRSIKLRTINRKI